MGGRVPKASMPLGTTGGSTQQGLTKGGSIRWLDGVEGRLTSPFQKNFLGLSILNRKMPRMIFKKYSHYHEKIYERKEDA
jgi:hypothetical protein